MYMRAGVTTEQAFLDCHARNKCCHEQILHRHNLYMSARHASVRTYVTFKAFHRICCAAARSCHAARKFPYLNTLGKKVHSM